MTRRWPWSPWAGAEALPLLLAALVAAMEPSAAQAPPRGFRAAPLHIASGDQGNAGWRPVPLPLHLGVRPGRRPWLALTLAF